jgi:hypothetical protein
VNPLDSVITHQRYRMGFGCIDPGTGYGPRMIARFNQITGEEIPVEPWVNQIHPDDWDWYENHWAWMDAFEYQVRLAVLAAGAP